MRTIQQKTKKILEIEEKENILIEELLRNMFVDDNMNLLDMANKLGIAYPTLLKWLKLAGVYSRKL